MNRNDPNVALQLLEKIESLLYAQRELSRLSPNYSKIDRRDSLTRWEFLNEYYSINKPVIISGMMKDWPALNQWSTEYLRAKYGDNLVEIQVGRSLDKNYEINSNNLKQNILLSEYIDMISLGGETNDYYMTAGNQALSKSGLSGLLDDIVFPEFLDKSNTNERVFLWFGPSGSLTPLHHDVVNVMTAQVLGNKRWRFISPCHLPLIYNYLGVYSEVDLEDIDYGRYPLFREISIIEEEVRPGEMIFIPTGWWHQVKSLEVSISISAINFVFPNEYQYRNPDLRGS